MRAMRLVSAGAKTLVSADVPVPAPGPGEVLVRVRTVGLCHTDVGMVAGEKGLRRGYDPTYPLIPGHEYHGEVVSHGPGATRPPIGQRVVGSAHVTCRRCNPCRSARSMLCPRLEVLGLDRDGAFAEFVCVPAINLVEVPASLPDRLVGLAEPFAVAAHAVELADCLPGDRVAVVGPGAVGLLAVGALAGREVTVIGTPQDEEGLRLARRLGATHTAVSHGEPQPAAGFDVVLETAGAPEAVVIGAQMLGPGGRMVCVGLPARPASLDTAQLARQEQVVLGSRAYDHGTWAGVPKALESRPELAELVTHILPLDAATKAIELVAERRALKVLLAPHTDLNADHAAPW